MVWRNGFVAMVTLACFSILISDNIAAQGTATGWVVADDGDSESDISPGQNATQVFAGAGSLNTTSSSSSPGGAVDTQSSFPDVKVRVDSRGLSAGEVAYGGAYFEDSITILGGTGSFTMHMNWTFDGGVSGSDGEYWIGNNPGTGSTAGSAAANFRVFLDVFGEPTLDLADPDLFKNVALQPSGMLEVPYYDPLSPDEGILTLPGGGNFVFDELDEEGMPTGEHIEAWYTDTNADQLAFVGGGAEFTWDYGAPLEFGILLEGWAADGGVVDFWNTGTLTGLTLPAGATLVSAGGGSYNITHAVPEPTAAAALWMGAIGVWMRRRKPQTPSAA